MEVQGRLFIVQAGQQKAGQGGLVPGHVGRQVQDAAIQDEPIVVRILFLE